MYFYFSHFFHITEEVILAEERTTEEERLHIMEGKFFQAQ